MLLFLSSPGGCLGARAGAAAPNGNTVSLETEMIAAVETRHAHETALSIYETTRNILRTALGMLHSVETPGELIDYPTEWPGGFQFAPGGTVIAATDQAVRPGGSR